MKSLYPLVPDPELWQLVQAAMQHPALSGSGQRSMLENLLQFGSLLDQYETASGKRVPDDLTVSTVLRCIDAPTRKHIEMIMDNDFSCVKLKEKLIVLDRNTRSWSGDSFLNGLQTLQGAPSSSSTTHQGPMPMEADQVQFDPKGIYKGKNKGKSWKGKKGGWFGFPYCDGKNNGNGKGSKTNGKSKGKKGNQKGKNKGKSHKGRALVQTLAAYVDRLVIWAMSVPVVTTTSVRSTRTRQQLTSEG